MPRKKTQPRCKVRATRLGAGASPLSSSVQSLSFKLQSIKFMHRHDGFEPAKCHHRTRSGACERGPHLWRFMKYERSRDCGAREAEHTKAWLTSQQQQPKRASLHMKCVCLRQGEWPEKDTANMDAELHRQLALKTLPISRPSKI